ncbi:MAG: hypothetical protein WCT18_00775 [Patescibacteria group bacterium]
MENNACQQKINIENKLLLTQIENRLKNSPEFLALSQNSNENYFVGIIKKIDNDIFAVEKETYDLQTILTGQNASLPIKIMPETEIFAYSQKETGDPNYPIEYAETKISAKDLRIDDRIGIEIIPSPISSYLPAKTVMVVR